METLNLQLGNARMTIIALYARELPASLGRDRRAGIARFAARDRMRHRGAEVACGMKDRAALLQKKRPQGSGNEVRNHSLEKSN